MPLVRTTEMFKKAYGKYAVGAFNVNNMEIVQGITEAAMEENVKAAYGLEKTVVPVENCRNIRER